MSPLEPLTTSAAVPAARGAASPVCSRVGMVTKPSVPEANTQGASGMAQLNARAALSRADVEGAELRSLADVVTAVRCAVTTAITIASRRMVAASPNDTRTPGGPAEAITPAAKGPTAAWFALEPSRPSTVTSVDGGRSVRPVDSFDRITEFLPEALRANQQDDLGRKVIPGRAALQRN